MPIRIHCPSCQSALQMPETMYGKAVRCPSCKNAFQCPAGPAGAAPMAPPPPPPPAARPVPAGSPFDFNAPAAPPAAVPAAQPYGGAYGYQEEPVYAPRRRRTPWGTVRVGLVFVEIATILGIIPLIIMYVLILGESQPSSGARKAVATINVILHVGAMVFMTIGLFMCGAASAKSGAKGTALFAAITALLTTIASGIIQVIYLIALFGDKGQLDVNADFLTATSMVADGGGLALTMLLTFFLLILALFLQLRGIAASVIAQALLLILVLRLSPYAQFLQIVSNPAQELTSRLSGLRLPATSKPGAWFHVAALSMIFLALWFVLINVLLSAGIGRAERRSQT